MGTEWHTGIVEDEVGHSGAKQLFSGMVVWSIFHNGIEVKSSIIELKRHKPVELVEAEGHGSQVSGWCRNSG